MKIAVQTVVSTLFGLAFFAVLLFVPAGTVDYWQAWVFIAVFVVVTIVPNAYLAVRNPAALARRMKAGPGAETRTVQKLVMTGTVLSVVAVLVVSALDHRFGWSTVPTAAVIVGDVLVAAGLIVTQAVVFQNNYAAATITVEADQPLVSTGLYGVVRHPMYAGALIMMVAMPPALDSWWGLAVIVPAIAILGARVLDEEKLMRQELTGYPEYMQKVRYRLVPGVW